MATCTVYQTDPSGGQNLPATFELSGESWRLRDSGTQYIDACRRSLDRALEQARDNLQRFGSIGDIVIDGRRFQFDGF